jgi:hypothetical protein
MLMYLGVGAGVGAVRLLLERLGFVRFARQDSTWILAVALTDVLCWPLVLLVLLLQRAVARSTG